jgi:hypothetical protein
MYSSFWYLLERSSRYLRAYIVTTMSVTWQASYVHSSLQNCAMRYATSFSRYMTSSPRFAVKKRYCSKGKIKLFLCLTNWALRHVCVWGTGCIAPHYLDLVTRWRGVVSFTPLPLYPRGKSPRYPLDRRQSGPQSRSGRRGEQKNLALLPSSL